MNKLIKKFLNRSVKPTEKENEFKPRKVSTVYPDGTKVVHSKFKDDEVHTAKGN